MVFVGIQEINVQILQYLLLIGKDMEINVCIVMVKFRAANIATTILIQNLLHALNVGMLKDTIGTQNIKIASTFGIVVEKENIWIQKHKLVSFVLTTNSCNPHTMTVVLLPVQVALMLIQNKGLVSIAQIIVKIVLIKSFAWFARQDIWYMTMNVWVIVHQDIHLLKTVIVIIVFILVEIVLEMCAGDVKKDTICIMEVVLKHVLKDILCKRIGVLLLCEDEEMKIMVTKFFNLDITC